MDIEIAAGEWSAVIDDELNGFGDDPMHSGLIFSNDPSILDYVHGVNASLNTSSDQGSTRIAYDDIYVLVLEAGTDLDLYVDSIELSQAIQDGSIPLIADRPTFARVFIGWSGIQDQVLDLDGRLTVTADGAPISGSPFSSLNGPFTAPRFPDAENEHDALNFMFSAPESTHVDVEVEINPAGPERFPETNYSNNTFAKNDEDFECRAPLSIAYVPIDYRPTAGGPGPNLPDPDMIAPGAGDSFVRGIYPAPVLTYYEVPPMVWRLDINDTGQAGLYLMGLNIRRVLLWPDMPDYLYAWLPGNPYAGNGRALDIPSRVAFGNTEASRYQRTFAHELGHCFGLYHPGGGDPDGDPHLDIYGVDVEDLLGLGRIKSSTLFGIMNPGHLTDEAWVDLTSYQWFLGADIVGCGGNDLLKSIADTDVLLVAGLFDPKASTASIEQIYELSPRPLTESDPGGNLILRAYHLDPDPTLLYEVRFTASSVDCPDGLACLAPFGPVVPAIAGDPGQSVNRVDIVLAATEELLAQHVRSASSPEIAITNPAPGEELMDEMEVTWTGTDADGDSIHYVLAYSWDGGQSYMTLIVDTTDTSFTLAVDAIPGSDPGQGRFRLTGTDGMNTVEVQVGDLALNAPKSPVAEILSPSEGESILEGAPVHLSASVHDPEDGQLPESSIEWSSDVDGLLGNGASIVVDTLSISTHELFVTATDSNLVSTTDSVTINVDERPSEAAPEDFNHDGAVDLQDFVNFWRCVGGVDNPPSPTCPPGVNADLDGDADVDLLDWAVFQVAFTGPNP